MKKEEAMTIDTTTGAVDWLAKRIVHDALAPQPLCDEAADTLRALAAERDGKAQEACQALDMWKKAAAERDAARAEAARLRGAWLRVIQSENYCNPSGAECQAKRCGCAKEMELYISDHDAALAQKDAGNE
jgi:hypothetical protein